MQRPAVTHWLTLAALLIMLVSTSATSQIENAPLSGTGAHRVTLVNSTLTVADGELDIANMPPLHIASMPETTIRFSEAPINLQWPDVLRTQHEEPATRTPFSVLAGRNECKIITVPVGMQLYITDISHAGDGPVTTIHLNGTQIRLGSENYGPRAMSFESPFVLQPGDIIHMNYYSTSTAPIYCANAGFGAVIITGYLEAIDS